MFKLFKKFIVRNKKYTFIIIAGIVLPVMMMFSLIQLANSIGLKYKDFLISNERQDFKVSSIDKETCEKIIKNAKEVYKDEVERIEVSAYIGQAYFENIDTIRGTIISTKEEGIREINDFKILEGKYPEKPFEIAIEKSVSNKFDQPFKVGDTINLDVEDGEGNLIKKSFSISGIMCDTPMQGSTLGKQSYVFTNKSTVEALEKEGFIFLKDNYNIDFLVDKNKFDEDKAFEIMTKIYPMIDDQYLVKLDKNKKGEATEEEAKSIGDVVKKVKINETKVTAYGEKDSYDSFEISIKIISIIISIAMVLLVYSNINLVTIERIKQYGALRCIGMSQKQLSKMIVFETAVYGVVGVAFGIILGTLLNSVIGEKIMYMVVGREVKLAGTFKSYCEILILVAFSLLIVSVGIILKMKKFQPTEALNYSESNKFFKSKTSSYNLKEKQKLISLFAKRNLKRNLDKTIVNFISLVVSITLIMVIVNGVFSINKPEKSYKSKFSDYEIVQGFSGGNKSYISEEKISKISDMENVRKVYALNNIVENTFSTLDDKDNPQIVTYNNELFGKLIQDNNLKDINYLNEDIAIFIKDKNLQSQKSHFEKFQKEVNNTLQGYISNIYTEDKKKVSFKLDKCIEGYGVNQGGTPKPDGEYIIINENLARKLYGGISYTDIMIDLGGKVTEDFERNISKLLKDEIEVTHGKYDAGFEESEREVLGMIILIAYMLFATGLVTFLNIRNTIKANIINRKKENGVLRAIGMSNKLLTKVIKLENIKLTIYAAITSIIISMPINMYVTYTLTEKSQIKLWIYILISIIAILCIYGISALEIKKNLSEEIIAEVNEY